MQLEFDHGVLTGIKRAVRSAAKVGEDNNVPNVVRDGNVGTCATRTRSATQIASPAAESKDSCRRRNCLATA